GIERAVVALVFGRDSGGNRLIAFEAARWIKVFALFAGVQSEAALRALPDRVGEILQQRAAFRTARDGPRSRHVDRARPEGVFFFWGRWLLELFYRSRTGILVSALPILGVGQKAPPENRIIVRLWRVWHKSFFVVKRKRRCRGKCPSICELYVEVSSEQGSYGIRATGNRFARSSRLEARSSAAWPTMPQHWRIVFHISGCYHPLHKEMRRELWRIMMAVASCCFWRDSVSERSSACCTRRTRAMKRAT